MTDLGTEFGVEVDKQGRTISHVFRGVVRVQMVAGDGKPQGRRKSCAKTSRYVWTAVSTESIIVAPSAKSARFVREIPKPTIKTFDLADVVAGGDGFSGRRGRGIDPANGRPTDSTLAEPKNANTQDYARFRIVSDGKYHRAETFPLVDGVFIPDGRPGGVQVDSAGHVVC